MPHEGPTLHNEKIWKLGVSDRKLVGSDFSFHCCF